MRWVLVWCAVLSLALPARAENPTPYSGTRVIETDQAFDGFVSKLLSAIKANKMGIVAQACANCGAKSIGVTIPGNRVIMIFRPDFAVRMLEASEAAGIEAPLRLYVAERPGGTRGVSPRFRYAGDAPAAPDGGARLTYRLPSHVFAPYQVPALDEMAKELDAILARIVAAATG